MDRTIANPQVRQIFDIWLTYYNRWMDFDEHGIPAKEEEWTVSDHARGLYGETRLLDYTDGVGQNTEVVLTIQVSNGDDGGPSLLVAGYDASWFGDPGEDAEPQFVVHIFDTIPLMIWTNEHGYRVPPDGEFEADIRRKTAH